MTNQTQTEEIILILQFLNKTIHENKQSDITINTTTTLWIILFSLILTQKIIKYIVKPCQRMRQNINNGENNPPNHDPSVECLVV